MRTLVNHHVNPTLRADRSANDICEYLRILHMQVPNITPDDLLALTDVFTNFSWRIIFKEIALSNAELGTLRRHTHSDYGF
jgi:hypothetical protein